MGHIPEKSAEINAMVNFEKFLRESDDSRRITEA